MIIPLTSSRQHIVAAISGVTALVIFALSLFMSCKSPGATGPSAIINTTEIGRSIKGYAGPVPLKIHISVGRIDSITVLPNTETPRFFRRLADGGLLHAWDGMPVEDALDKEVDAISGATFSSKAVIGNVRAGLTHYLDSIR